MVALSPTLETDEAETGIWGETKSSPMIPVKASKVLHVGQDGQSVLLLLHFGIN